MSRHASPPTAFAAPAMFARAADVIPDRPSQKRGRAVVAARLRAARSGARFVIAILLSIAVVACATDDESRPTPETAALPATARLDIHHALTEDLSARRHPSDGGGSVTLDAAGAVPAMVSAPARWTLVYRAGPLGVADGGTIFFQVSPFWGWSAPQVEDRFGYGYTEVTTDATGITLTPRPLGNELLAIKVSGRALAAGEIVRIAYGAGPLGAIADRYAERASRFWVAVDGDGDGVRAVVRASPAIDIAPGPPARLQVVLPTTARPGDALRLTIAILDATGNTGVDVAGRIELESIPPGLEVPGRVVLAPGQGGRITVPAVARSSGMYRVRASGPGDLTAESNPLEVSTGGPRILWADLHGHSNLSDGTGVPEDYFLYARDVTALDVVALTDHDHWGVEFLDRHPELWQQIRAQTQAFHEPHRFVTLLGYEWTNWIYGHRHVLYFSDDGDVLGSLDPPTDTPAGLWAALAGRPALTIAHHSAGGPIAIDWTQAPDPVLEPVTEVVSVHGSSEAADSPARIYAAVDGNFVRDALARGYHLGFVGSGDSHDGHPGNAHLAGPTGGVAAILSEELTRPAVLAALRARRVYATSGPRILLRTSLGTARMGEILPAPPAGGEASLAVRAVGTAPLDRIDVIRTGAVAHVVPGDGSSELAGIIPLTGLSSKEYIYVRVVQQDGGLAWSSPVFIQ